MGREAPLAGAGPFGPRLPRTRAGRVSGPAWLRKPGRPEAGPRMAFGGGGGGSAVGCEPRRWPQRGLVPTAEPDSPGRRLRPAPRRGLRGPGVGASSPGGGGGGRGVRLSEVLGTEGRGACARPSLRCRDVRSPLLHPPAVCACQRLGSPHPLCPLSLPGGHCASGGFQGTPGAGEAVAEQISRHPQSPEPGEPRHGAQPAVSFLCPGQRPLRARPLPARPPLAPQLRLGSRARGLRAR